MINEVKILNEYLGDGIDFLYNKDKDLLEKVVANIYKIEPFEHPDMILSLGEKIMAIEHFEFDASTSNKKGSLDKRKLADRNREFDKLVNDSNISAKPVVASSSIDCNYSAEDYIENFISVFGKHLAKVADYKNYLIEENKAEKIDDIIICFFIVDTTPLGCYYMENGPKSLIACQVKECLDLISKASEVDCFLFGYFDGRKNSLEFISNQPEVVNIIKEVKMIDFKVEEFFTFNPKETRYCMQIGE